MTEEEKDIRRPQAVTSTHDLITYIVDEVSDRRLDVTKTALVKLLYLSDIEALRLGQPRVTSVRWILYRYGPWAGEIDDAIRMIAGKEIDERSGISALGRAYRTYRRLGTDPPPVPADVKGIILRVIERWGGVPLKPLLNYVYFNTEPMLQAEWREPLDLSLVERLELPIRLHEYAAPRLTPAEARRLAEIKAEFRDAAAAKHRKRVKPSPEPRYDEVFFSAMEKFEEHK